jgi:hypothetical protein
MALPFITVFFKPGQAGHPERMRTKRFINGGKRPLTATMNIFMAGHRRDYKHSDEIITP